MKVKAFLSAAILALSPVAGFAACTGYGHETQAMTCAEGSVYDAATNTCKVISS